MPLYSHFILRGVDGLLRQDIDFISSCLCVKLVSISCWYFNNVHNEAQYLTVCCWSLGLIRPHVFQDNKADVILKYNADEARSLKAYGELPEHGELEDPIYFYCHLFCAWAQQRSGRWMNMCGFRVTPAEVLTDPTVITTPHFYHAASCIHMIFSHFTTVS